MTRHTQTDEEITLATSLANKIMKEYGITEANESYFLQLVHQHLGITKKKNNTELINDMPSELNVPFNAWKNSIKKRVP